MSAFTCTEYARCKCHDHCSIDINSACFKAVPYSGKQQGMTALYDGQEVLLHFKCDKTVTVTIHYNIYHTADL